MRLPRGSATGVARHWRVIATFAVLGAIAGALLAVSSPPRHESTAGVVVTKDRIASDPIELRRFAELAGGSQVAEEAAALLGGDLPGADVLTSVEVVVADGGVLAVEATADSPDFAPAVATAYASAIVDVLGGPLEAGSAAGAASEVGGRSLPLWSLLGLLVGTLAGAALAVSMGAGLISLDSARLRRRSPQQAESGQPESTRLSEALPASAEIVTRDSTGAVRLSLPAKGIVTDLIEGINFDGGRHRTLAVLAAEEADPSGAAAAAIAVAAAGRGLHVLVIDARLDTPSVAEVLGVEPEPGLAEYLSGFAGPRKVLRRVPAVDQERQPSQLACLPAGDGERGAGIPGGRFTELVDRVAKVYDLVVLAGPSPAEGSGDVSALTRVADGTIVVCGVDPGVRSAAEEAAKALGGATLHGVVSMERP